MERGPLCGDLKEPGDWRRLSREEGSGQRSSKCQGPERLIHVRRPRSQRGWRRPRGEQRETELPARPPLLAVALPPATSDPAPDSGLGAWSPLPSLLTASADVDAFAQNILSFHFPLVSRDSIHLPGLLAILPVLSPTSLLWLPTGSGPLLPTLTFF